MKTEYDEIVRLGMKDGIGGFQLPGVIVLSISAL